MENTLRYEDFKLAIQESLGIDAWHWALYTVFINKSATEGTET